MWLEESSVSSAISAISGSSGSVSAGLHGLGLGGVSVSGTELGEEVASVSAEETPEVEVEVENQGESTENGIGVTVTVEGNELQGTIESIGVGETGSVSIPLTPAPSGEVKLEVDVEAVPGEHVTTNNEASYTVVFE
jgi:subtilase family serine protease